MREGQDDAATVKRQIPAGLRLQGITKGGANPSHGNARSIIALRAAGGLTSERQTPEIDGADPFETYQEFRQKLCCASENEE